MESNHTVICAADAATNSRRSTAGMAATNGGNISKDFDDIDNDVGPSSHHTIESTRRRSSRVSVALPLSKKRDEQVSEAEDDE